MTVGDHDPRSAAADPDPWNTPGPPRPTGARRGLLILLVIVAWAAAVFLLLSGIAALTQLNSSWQKNQGGGVGPGIAAGVFLCLAAVAVFWLGLWAEHRLRGHRAPALPQALSRRLRRSGPARSTAAAIPGLGTLGPGAILHTDTDPPRSTPAATFPARVRQRHRHHPLSAVFVILIFLGIFLWAPIYTVAEVVSYERSASTQHHGIRADAIITHLTNTQHCGRGGCYYTASAQAQLVPPVDGVSTTTIHAAGQLTGGSGAIAGVLLDRHDLHYAELPGDPLTHWYDALIPGVIWALLWGLTGWGVIRGNRRSRRRHHHRRRAVRR